MKSDRKQMKHRHLNKLPLCSMVVADCCPKQYAPHPPRSWRMIEYVNVNTVPHCTTEYLDVFITFVLCSGSRSCTFKVPFKIP